MIEFITDRTVQDVFDGTDKGWLNYTDVNRIVYAISYLINYFKLNISALRKANYESRDILYKDEVDDIVAHINSIRNVTPIKIDIKTPTQMLMYTDLNDIEKILELLYNYYNERHEQKKLYSGTFRAGNHIKFGG